MNNNKRYIIVLRGCDDINKSLIDFNDNFTLENFIFYARHLNSKCECCCQPTIHLYYGDSKLYKNLDLYNLDYFDDLVGGYYEKDI